MKTLERAKKLVKRRSPFIALSGFFAALGEDEQAPTHCHDVRRTGRTSGSAFHA